MRTIGRFVFLVIFLGAIAGAVAAAFIEPKATPQTIVKSVDIDKLGEER